MQEGQTTSVTVEHPGASYAEYLPLINTFALAAFFVFVCFCVYRFGNWIITTGFPEFKQTIKDATQINAAAASSVKESVDKHIDMANNMLVKFDAQHTDIISILKEMRK